jgi:L-fuculose-phosphate aldolase
VTEDEQRDAVLACARDLERRGLNHGTSGNVSARCGDGVLVTPSGIAPERLRRRDIVRLDAAGRPAPGQRVPTSEWRLHVALLAIRPDVAAVVHTHSPEATAVACLRESIPAVHYAVAWTGATVVPCADYATYGSAELAASVVAAIGMGGACLLANHGLVTVGATLTKAAALAVEIEWLAQVWRVARSHGAPVHLLDDGEMARIAERFAGYGQGDDQARRGS